MNEFQLIQHFFSHTKTERADVILGIGDDAALLQPPSGQSLAVSSDTLIAGVHFFEKEDPYDIGYKSLAVNLSDLAAMGAEPAWLMLSLTLPVADENWLQGFCRGLFELVDEYQLQLVGGDVTKGKLSITLQVMGFVPAALALRRSGAKPGDKIYVTGHLGDAGLALHLLKHHKDTREISKAILRKLKHPIPRINVGLALRGIASSAIDISDGLFADLSHIVTASGVGAFIDVDNLPLSPALKQLSVKDAYNLALSAGDDYELCFTLSPEDELRMLTNLNVLLIDTCTCIGTITSHAGLRLQQRDGSIFTLEKTGFQHF